MLRQVWIRSSFSMFIQLNCFYQQRHAGRYVVTRDVLAPWRHDDTRRKAYPTKPDPGYQWESDKLTEDTTNESQEVSPFPADDHEAHINRRAQNIANTRQNNNIKDPQKKYRLGTVSKIFYWRA